MYPSETQRHRIVTRHYRYSVGHVTYIHAYIHTYSTYMHAYIHTHIQYIHTYTHTHTHTIMVAHPQHRPPGVQLNKQNWMTLLQCGCRQGQMAALVTRAWSCGFHRRTGVFWVAEAL